MILLIEPVWNRNLGNSPVKLCPPCCRLLIEPVWNRNLTKRVNFGNQEPFNRTSMESKRVLAQDQTTATGFLLIEPVWNRNINAYDTPMIRNRSFNRTSMESKRLWHCNEARAKALLIEPVWNRNKPARLDVQVLTFLLIEPVWNRNAVI